MINLFGGSGFVGTTFKEKYECIANERNDLVPKLASGVTDILYLISTIDNYNVTINPHVDIDTNLTTLVRVLENFRQLNKPNVVFNFASSWFVYGDTELPARETSYCDPRGFYSITKRAAEQLLISYCETYNLKYRILRFANVLGPGDKKVSKKKNALTYLINRIKNNEEINLYDNGNFYRDYMHVSDLCYATRTVMQRGGVNEIFNIGNGKPILFKEIIEYAVQKSGSSSKINYVEQPDFHKQVQVKSMYMDNSKIRSLGYSPIFIINTIVNQLLNEDLT
jgi:nucleoside-diphosphate-sugar epimerase